MYIFDLWPTHKWTTTGVEKCYICKCESIINPLTCCTDGGSRRRKTSRNLYNSKTLPSSTLPVVVYILKSCRCSTVTAESMSQSKSSGICVIVFLWGPGRQADLMKTMDVAYSSTAFNLLTEPCVCPCTLQHCLITLSVLYLASVWEKRTRKHVWQATSNRKGEKLLHSNGGKSTMGLISISARMNLKTNGKIPIYAAFFC